MSYTDVLCLHLNCRQEGSQDCFAPVRIIHDARGLCMTLVKDRPPGTVLESTCSLLTMCLAPWFGLLI